MFSVVKLPLNIDHDWATFQKGASSDPTSNQQSPL